MSREGSSRETVQRQHTRNGPGPALGPQCVASEGNPKMQHPPRRSPWARGKALGRESYSINADVPGGVQRRGSRKENQSANRSAKKMVQHGLWSPLLCGEKLRSDHALPPMRTCSSMNRRCLKSSQSSVSMRCLVFSVICGDRAGGWGGCRNKVLVPARATRTLLRGDFLNDASDHMWRQKKLQLQKVTGRSTLAAH